MLNWQTCISSSMIKKKKWCRWLRWLLLKGEDNFVISKDNYTLSPLNSNHGPLTRYGKLWVVHAPGIPGRFPCHGLTVTWYWCMMCRFDFLPAFSNVYIRQVTQVSNVPVMAARNGRRWCMRTIIQVYFIKLNFDAIVIHGLILCDSLNGLPNDDPCTSDLG